MKALSPQPAEEISVANGASGVRASWWIASLAGHVLILGILFLLIPSPPPASHVERQQRAQPAVSRSTAEQTIRKLEQKQSAELARKLRELESLAGAITSAEQTHRVAHAAFEAAFVQLTPELARDLVAQASERLRRLEQLMQDDEHLWQIAEESLVETLPGLQAENYAALKPLLESARTPFLSLPPSQHAVNFAQSALVETLRQISDRLAFIRAEIPALVEKQTALSTAWGAVMGLGGDYARRIQPLTDLFQACERIVTLLIQTDRSIADRIGKVSVSDARVAKWESELQLQRDALTRLNEELKTLDPADTRRAGRLKNDIKRADEAIARIQRTLEKEQTENAFVKRLLGESEASRAARLAELSSRLAEIRPRFETLATAREEYLARLREAVVQQTALEPAMREAFPKVSDGAVEGAEPTDDEGCPPPSA